jgi:hypothetical protein
MQAHPDSPSALQPVATTADPLAPAETPHSQLPSVSPSDPAIHHSVIRHSSFDHPTIIDTKPLPASPATQRKARRTGRIACLPKIQRDMVNRMLTNGVP